MLQSNIINNYEAVCAVQLTRPRDSRTGGTAASSCLRERGYLVFDLFDLHTMRLHIGLQLKDVLGTLSAESPLNSPPGTTNLPLFTMWILHSGS